VRYLLDTCVLLCAAYAASKISSDTAQLVADVENSLIFSSAGIWKTGIKSMLGREDFQVDVSELLRGLRMNGYEELEVSSNRALAQTFLPALHRDPFDRILARIIHEGENSYRRK